MLDLGGSFSNFVDALLGFINSLLMGVFDFLSGLLGGINVTVG